MNWKCAPGTSAGTPGPIGILTFSFYNAFFGSGTVRPTPFVECFPSGKFAALESACNFSFIYPSDMLGSTGLATKIANFIAVSGLTSIPMNALNTNWIFKKVGLWFYYVGLK